MSLEEQKCQYGMCVHGEQAHINGSCMHITQPDLAGQPTMKKYCPCGALEGHNHRLFELTGFMEPKYPDHMITKKCSSCGDMVLLNTDESRCLECKSKEFYQ